MLSEAGSFVPKHMECGPFNNFKGGLTDKDWSHCQTSLVWSSMADLARYVVRYPFPTSPIKSGLFWCQWHQVTSCHITLLLVICRRGNNGGWRRGGPSAGDHPPIPWALRQVFLQTDYNSRKSWFATFTILMCNVHHSRISYMSVTSNCTSFRTLILWILIFQQISQLLIFCI